MVSDKPDSQVKYITEKKAESVYEKFKCRLRKQIGLTRFWNTKTTD